jgi:hypothetical protein
MVQVLNRRSDGHTHFKELLCLNTTYVMDPRTTFDSCRNHASVFEAKPMKSPLDGFVAQPPNCCR